ncbi:MAG TPA: hypothetical protein VD931_07565 [Baekduia sp.]|nr:hypothetical protein [Baekduia sp.]
MSHHQPVVPAPRRRRLLATAAAALVLGLAACGGDDNAAEQPKGDVEDQLGFNQSAIDARQSRVEAAIRDCMKAEGFEYVPVDPIAQRAAVTGSGRLSDEDFLQQFGYGISTLWGRGGNREDPNRTIRAGLGPADQRAYDRALYGENAGATFFAAVDSGDFSELGGCTKKATEQVFGGAAVLNELTGKLDELEERILEDQRMTKAIEAWSACMADKGFRYEEPEAIDEDLLERMEELVGSYPGQFATGPKPGESAKDFDPADLKALQREEVQIARADDACEKEHITPVEDEVAPEYQEQFRRSNQALIEQVKPAP